MTEIEHKLVAWPHKLEASNWRALSHETVSESENPPTRRVSIPRALALSSELKLQLQLKLQL